MPFLGRQTPGSAPPNISMHVQDFLSLRLIAAYIQGSWVDMASSFHIHHGSSVLSDFRKSRLAQEIGAEVEAKYVHYVALYEALTAEETRNLNALLTYNQVPQPPKSTPSGK